MYRKSVIGKFGILVYLLDLTNLKDLLGLEKKPPLKRYKPKRIHAMKHDPFLPNNIYLIENSGNNYEPIFLEERNYAYFLALCERHIAQVGVLHSFRLLRNRFELLVEFNDVPNIEPKYRQRLHQPFSNLFNAYCKAVNKAYGRSGSLFREHFSRRRLDENQAKNIRVAMDDICFNPNNFKR